MVLALLDMDRIRLSLLHLVVFAVCVVAVGNAAAATSAAEVYWRKALPNTPMPSIIQELIAGDGRSPRVLTSYRPLYSRTTTQDFPSDPHLFFLESDLRPGAAMRPGLTFNRTIAGAAFFPRAAAASLPLSSAALPAVLRRLGVLPGSEAAKEAASTIQDCEAPAAGGERKLCAASLEAMVDFAVAQLAGRSVRVAASAPVRGGGGAATAYAVAPAGVRRLGAGAVVACHPEPFPRGVVYYCHKTRATRAYAVALDGRDGSAVAAVAACHSDTAKWNPAFFKLLGVKPGGEAICHFLPQDHLIWSASY